MVKDFEGVTDYKFINFTDSDVSADVVQDYNFKPLFDKTQIVAREDFQKTIKIERTNATQAQFKISSIVEEHRGLKDQAEAEYEARVQQEVNIRVAAMQENAYAEGFNAGVSQGREEIFNEMRNVVDQKLDNFSLMITEVLKTQEEILEKQKKEIYEMLKNLTKWVILRELKDDGKYIERLFEKLLVEIQARSNLLVLVNEANFKEMPEVLEHVETRLGQLKNVRIEIDSSVSSNGIILESDNGIINGTIEEQFLSLDKLFEDLIVDN